MSIRTVCTIGCYDLLHVGHLDFLEEASAYGDMLIVGLPNDELYMALKGRSPVISAEARSEMLMATGRVDYVDILRSMDYAAWVDRIAPEILALSVDHTAERFTDAAIACIKNGGKVVRIPRSERESSSAIVDRAWRVREGKI